MRKQTHTHKYQCLNKQNKVIISIVKSKSGKMPNIASEQFRVSIDIWQNCENGSFDVEREENKL